MQLDDDSLLALYYVYDPEGTGYLAYMDLVKHLMHPDTFCYYVGHVDNSQAATDATLVRGFCVGPGSGFGLPHGVQHAGPRAEVLGAEGC